MKKLGFLIIQVILRQDKPLNGETGTYRNGRFAWFESPEAGLRAMKMDLTKKLNDFDGNLPAMIEKYARLKKMVMTQQISKSCTTVCR
jgi:hypothetical protein